MNDENDPIKAIIFESNNDRFCIEIPFSEDKAKKIAKAIKYGLTLPENMEIISTSKPIKSMAGIRSRLNEQGISSDEYIGFLFDKGIIDEIAEKVMSLFKNCFLSKRMTSIPKRLINDKKFNETILKPYDIGNIEFNTIQNIKLKETFDEEDWDLWDPLCDIDIKFNDTINKDNIKDKNSESIDGSRTNRFITYRLDLSRRKKDAIEFDLDYTGICKAIAEVIEDYMYNRKGLVDNLYKNNLIQMNQIESIVQDDSKTNQLFNCSKVNISQFVTNSRGGYIPHDIDGQDISSINTNEYETAINDIFEGYYGCKIRIFNDLKNINGDHMKITLDNQQLQNDNRRDLLFEIVDKMEVIVNGSIDILHELSQSSDFDNSDGIAEAAIQGWKTIGNLFNQIRVYLENHDNISFKPYEDNRQ